MHTTSWHVDVLLFVEEGRTRAEAVLRTDAGTELRHQGVARKHPADTDVLEIGEELAACRALTGLAHDLLEAAVVDVAENDPASGRPRIAIDAG